MTHTTVRRAGQLITGIALAVVLAGCNGGGGEAEPTPTPEPTEEPTEDPADPAEFEAALAGWWAEDEPLDQIAACLYVDSDPETALAEMREGWAQDRPDGPEWIDDVAASWVEAHCEEMFAAYEDDEEDAPGIAGPPVPFGTTVEWDGLSVTVSEPEEFTPGEFAFAEDAEAYLRFDVRIENNTGEPFDPNLFFVTAHSGAAEAQAVFDDDLWDTPTTTLLDGRSVEFAIGFGVQDPTDVVMEVTPSWEHESAIFITE